MLHHSLSSVLNHGYSYQSHQPFVLGFRLHLPDNSSLEAYFGCDLSRSSGQMAPVLCSRRTCSARVPMCSRLSLSGGFGQKPERRNCTSPFLDIDTVDSFRLGRLTKSIHRIFIYQRNRLIVRYCTTRNVFVATGPSLGPVSFSSHYISAQSITHIPLSLPCDNTRFSSAYFYWIWFSTC
jgi:hypothetical protein